MKKLILIIVTAAMSICVSAQQAEEGRGYIVKVGDLAPDFTIELVNGTKCRLSDLRGRVVMLQFTASWCSVCRQEMPHIEAEIYDKYKNHPAFMLIGVDYMEDKATTAKFAEQMKISYPLALDEKGAIFHQFAEKGAGVTRNVIVDQKGRIAFMTRLFNREEFDAMKEAIAKLME